MKKLLLTSTFANVAEHLLPLLTKEPSVTMVAFIPTAADMYENPVFVEKDRKALTDMGLNVTDVHLSKITAEELQNTLKNIDVVFVAGGNTFYLLQEARKSGFTELIPDLVKEGLIYVGSSAGSYIACPTIEAAHWEPSDENDVGLTDLTAMALVPFLLSVHYEPQYRDSIVREKSETSFSVKILTNDQALVVQDDTTTLVGDTTEIII